MSTTSFEKEFKEYFKELNTPVKIFLDKNYRKSNSKSYYNFFDDFLFSYGIVSFNADPLLTDSPKYKPYLNCREKNIFNLEQSRTYLTNVPISLSKSNKLIAEFLIDKLNTTPLSKFENWSDD